MPPIILTRLYHNFFSSEKTGGIILVFCTAISLILTNIVGSEYVEVWNFAIGGETLSHWINDGLMTIFFLLIGLELEREIYIGEFSDLRNALLPLFAAIGGMLLPAGVFLLFNWEGEGRAGAGIPMATDIAFALGVLSMLGKRVPGSLKVFLTALAVIDDLGAILVIAVFYTKSLNLISLGIALGVMAALFIFNRLKVHTLWPYLIGGIFMWYFMLSSGVHATITGVLLAFVIPFGSGDEQSPSYRLQHVLHIPVAYVILPVFALANTCIFIDGDSLLSMGNMVGVGIMAGLLVGKPLGIISFSFLAVRLNISALPEDVKWSYVAGAAILAGIGFTMSIFITLLAFNDPAMVAVSKLAVLTASVLAGIAGFLLLRKVLSGKIEPEVA